jgi:hypothetical protein
MGLQNSGGRGLGTLGWRFLDGRFLPSKQREISNEIKMKKETIEDYLDFGRLIVAVFSDGVSSSALR